MEMSLILPDAVVKDIKRLTKFYPGLKLKPFVVPELKPPPPRLEGYIFYPDNHPLKHKKEFQIKVRVDYPINFPNSPVVIYDVDKAITVGKIPYKHVHVYDNGEICTHHMLELEQVPLKSRSIIQVLNAWRIFAAYKIWIKEKRWVLEGLELPHGDFWAHWLINGGL